MPFEQFPYTNFHELNLDWIIKEMKELKNKTDAIDDAVLAALDAAASAQASENAIKNILVTPEMYGASGNGLNDDSDAVQSAIDSGKIVIAQNKYAVSNIVINKPTIIIGGEFINLNSTEYVFTADDNNNIIDNIILYDIVIDGVNLANGIKLNYCKNSIVKNVTVKRIKSAALTTGMYLNRCYNVSIENCNVYDVTNDYSQPTRAILINRSKRCNVKNCLIHDVVSGNDGDGLHIIYDGATDEDLSGCIVSECRFYNCSKRYIKIQQKGVIIEKCKILNEDNTFNASDSSIALYDCDLILKDSYISGWSPVQVNLVGSENTDYSVYENVRILNNTIIGDSRSGYNSIISSATTPIATFKNLIIENNIIIGNGNNTGITLRNLSGEQCSISSNEISNNSIGVHFRLDGSNTATISKMTIADNLFEVGNVPVYMQYADYTFTYLSVTGNNYHISANGIGGVKNMVIFQATSFNNDNTKIINNVGNGYDGWNNLGYWNTRPTINTPNGFMFYCLDIHAPVYNYSGTWYKTDGTVYSG